MPKIPKEQLPPYGPKRKGRRTGKYHPAAASRARQGGTRQGDCASGDDDADGEPLRKFLTGPQVCARYSISEMSLWRWLQNRTLGFPAPTLIVHERRYWDEEILRQWELQRIVSAAGPSPRRFREEGH